MITNTEDKFDVDYDVFSFAGRAALIAGTIYATDKSIKENVFKKGPANLGKYNNAYINQMSEILKTDNKTQPKTALDMSKFKNKSFFKNTSPMPIPITLAGVHDEEIISLKNLLKDGGYKGRSSDLLGELEALRNDIRVIDNDDKFLHLRKQKPNVVSGRMTVQRDRSGKVLSVGIDSLAGKHIINVVDNQGMVTIGDNRYLARSQFSPEGLKVGKEYGVDVALTRFLRKNHAAILSGELSVGEVTSMFNKSLTYNGKAFDSMNSNRVSEEVAKNILGSAQDNVFSPMNRETKEIVMRDAALSNRVSSASNLNDSIVRLLGDDAISDHDGMAFTSNPNQLFRANTFYIDQNGVKQSLVDLNFAFLNDKQLARFQEIAKSKYGFDFGDLAKEELIGNSRILGSVGDNSRAMQIRGDYLTDSSEHILNRLVQASGLDKDAFEAKIREGGFAAFDPEARKRMQSITIDEHLSIMKDMKKQAARKRSALLHANSINFDELMAERESLADLRNVLTGRLRGVTGVGEGFQNESPEMARRLQRLYDGFRNTSKSDLQSNLNEVNKKLKIISKGLRPRGIKQEELAAALEIKKAGGLTAAIEVAENEYKLLSNKVIDATYFGLSKDRNEAKMLDREIRGLTINDLHLGENNQYTFSLLRTTKVGQGIKGIDESGEAKAIYKASSDNISDILKDLHIEEYGSITDAEARMYDNIHAIAKREALKTDITDRNLRDAIHSIRAKNSLESNQEVTKLLAKFDGSDKLTSDYDDLVRGLGKLGNGDLSQFMGTETAVGFIKNKKVSFGNAAIDLGAGNLGFLAERHIKLIASSGMINFALDITSRKSSAGAYKTWQDFSDVQKMMKDSVNSGYISFDNLGQDKSSFYRFMSEVFPSSSDVDRIQNLKNREDALKRLGKYDKGMSFVSLNGNFNGYTKIPVFADESLMGIIGEQIGYDGEFKKYTEIDRLTKDILYEAYSENRSSDRLKTLLKNYDVAQQKLGDTLRDRIFKGKVKNSMLGQVASGSSALNAYADTIFNKGIKNAMPSVAAVSKKQYIQMFGEDAYKNFIKGYKADKNFRSNTWAFAIREPVEGLSGMPVNVVPANVFDGIKDLDDKRISIVANRPNSIIGMLFGDYDGDQLSLIAATNEASAKEIEYYATSNEATAVEFRRVQESKIKFQLKGVHNKSLLANELASLTLSNYYAKNLEKGFVGIASNSLEGLHEVNSKLNSVTINGKKTGSDKFFRIEATLQTLAENIIKGKAQSVNDLKNKRSEQILNAIIGGEEFKNASITDRIKKFREFIDDITLGDASEFADRIRSGDRSAELINEVAGKLKGDVERANDIVNGEWFVKMTSDQAMEDIMEVSGLSAKGSDTLREAADNIIAKAAGDSAYRLSQLGEQTQEAINDAKKMMHGFSGNAIKYALLPAATMGILGTVFGARSSINSDVEFSDGQNQHDKSSSKPFKLSQSINMKQPTHMRPEIKGQGAQGFQINKYASSHATGNVRIQDDTRNFDYYDMQDSLRKGF